MTRKQYFLSTVNYRALCLLLPPIDERMYRAVLSKAAQVLSGGMAK